MPKALPPVMPPSAEDVEMIEHTVPEDEDHSEFVTVDGVMIKQDFDRFILDDSEVDKYTPLQCASMEQTLYVKYSYDPQVLTYFLYSYYPDVKVEISTAQTEERYDLRFVIESAIQMDYYRKAETLKVRWETSPKNDLIADSLCLLVLQIKEKPTPQLLQLMEVAARNRQAQENSEKLGIVLESHFDSVEYDFGGKLGVFKVSHPKYGSCLVDSGERRVI